MAEESSTERALNRLETGLSLLERAWGWPVIGAFTAGYSAYLTEPFQNLAPWSWVMAAIVGGIGVQGLLLLRSSMNERKEHANRIRNLQKPKGQINPMDDLFERKKIYISDLSPSYGHEVRGKTFLDCELVGPGVILFVDRITADTCGFVNCDFVRLKRGKLMVQNVLGFDHCVFRRCTFVGFTILSQQEMIEMFEKDAGGDALNVITD